MLQHPATVCEEATCTDNCLSCEASTQVDLNLSREASPQVDMNLSREASTQVDLNLSREASTQVDMNLRVEASIQVDMNLSCEACVQTEKRSDDCECKSQIVQFADEIKMLLKKKSVANDLPAAATFPATSCRRPNSCVSVATQVVRHHADVETQAEIDVHSQQRASAELHEKNQQIRRLQTENEDLSRLLQKHEKKIALMNERMDDILEEHRKEMRHLKSKYLDDNRELARKNRAMRDELSSYKEKRDDLQHARAQVMALRTKYYKETGALQRTVDQLCQQLRGLNARTTCQHRTVKN